MARAEGNDATVQLLACRVGSKVCALGLERVVETMRPLPAEPLARMPEFVSGVALIRGRPTPVIDARKLLGSPSEDRPERYVSFRIGDATRVAALAVDSVLGVRTIDAAALDELPSLFGAGPSEAVALLGTLDAELLLVLEHARLLPETTWSELERKPQPA